MKFSQKRIFSPKRKKWATHQFQHTQINLGVKFQLKQTSLVFWTKFSQAEFFWSKSEKMSINNEFSILELVEVSGFSLNRQSWFLGPNLPKTRISGLKQKKSEYRQRSLHELVWQVINPTLNNFVFLDLICACYLKQKQWTSPSYSA